ncbi:MAG: hypothetical protein ACK4UJ_03455 [Leptonema sp. (in: bacteria)]
MKNKKYIIISFLFGIFISISFVIYDFFSSPKYSLYIITKSIINKDFNKFQNYVDLDSVVVHFIEQWIDFYTQQVKNEQESFSLKKAQNTIKIKLLENAKPHLKKLIIYSIQLYFDKKQEFNQEKDYLDFIKNELNITKEDLLSILTLYKIHSIEYLENRKVSTVYLEIQKETNIPQILKLKFTKEHTKWKLVSIENLFEVLNKIF